MNKVKAREILLLALVLLAFVPGLIVYQQLPGQVPTHWNIHGQVDGYGSKFVGIFLLPVINLCLYALLKFLPKIDPKAKNYQYFSGAYSILRWAVHLFLLGIYLTILWSTLSGAQGRTLDPSKLIVLGVCLLFIVIGNYLGRIRHNYFVGIRTPWTLASEEVWNKTHRLGAKLWVVSGVIGLCGLLFASSISFIFLLVPILATSVFIVVYSYWIFRGLHQNR